MIELEEELLVLLPILLLPLLDDEVDIAFILDKGIAGVDLGMIK